MTLLFPERKPHTRRVQFGYINDPDSPEEDIHDPVIMPLLVKAIEALNSGSSLRDTAAWLSKESGRSLSYVALRALWIQACPDRVSQNKAPKKKPLTKEQRLLRNKKKKAGLLKRKITDTQRQLNSLTEVINTEAEELKMPQIKVRTFTQEIDTSSIAEDQEILFKPNEGPQTAFLEAPEQEVLYGGAAGGGKSYAVIADPMRYFDNPNFAGLIIRRTNDELRELIFKAQQLYSKIFGKKIIWREQKSTFFLPGGGTLWFSYLDRDDDVLKYQGQSWTYIAFDELTQHPTPYGWNYLRTRLRVTNSAIPCYMRATSNPGGPGHGWVKKMFVDPAPYGTPFWATDIETGEILTYPKWHKKAGQPLFKRLFIPATLKDNPYLYDDGNYETNLLSLPDGQLRQLLYGDWSIADGAAFPEFNLRDHVCKPFEIPHSWRRFRSCDFGYASHSAVHWYAVDPDGRLYVYRELYTSKKTAMELAHMILKLERDESIIYGVLDSSTWAKRGELGPSIAEEMIGQGCRWRPSDRSPGSRTSGKNRLHELLKVDKTGKPGIIFFDTCRTIISEMQVMPTDPDGTDDIDPDYVNDHAYDSIRYGIMTRPRPWTPSDSDYQKVYKPFDPVFGY